MSRRGERRTNKQTCKGGHYEAAALLWHPREAEELTLPSLLHDTGVDGKREVEAGREAWRQKHRGTKSREAETTVCVCLY